MRYRRHGFQWPLSGLQVSSWLCFLYQALITYSLILPNFPTTALISLSALYVFLSLSVVLTTIICTVADPTDPAVKSKRNPKVSQRAADVSNPAFPKLCLKCETHVGFKSKHCGVCNRCSANFDHHCAWLNNCVGKGNYRWFLVTIYLVEMAVALQAYSGAQLIVMIVSQGLESSEILAKYNVGDRGYLFLISISLVLVLSLLILFGNGFLLLFHIYLRARGISTYEYILLSRLRARVVPIKYNLDSNNPTSGVTKTDKPVESLFTDKPRGLRRKNSLRVVSRIAADDSTEDVSIFKSRVSDSVLEIQSAKS